MNRRDFLVNSTTASMMFALGAAAHAEKDGQSKASTPAAMPEKPKTPPINCAVIGLGAQGQAILSALAKMGAGAPVAGICDTYKTPVFVKRSTEILKNPAVPFSDDYRKVLDDKSVQAVFIATPSHKHKQIVLDALAAGKHVYCEAPLAVDLEEAKAIAQAGTAAKTIFQPGLQMRSNMQYKHVLHFIKAEALGRVTMARAQYHDRNSWSRVAPNDARQAELNWRLSQATSLGLLGEVGIHQLDVAGWFLAYHESDTKKNSNLSKEIDKPALLPLAITGHGAILAYNDGRDVQDTVQCTLEYPDNLRMVYDATLTNSFDGIYDAFFGTASAIQMRDQRAWMFKEADAPPLGWETFARKDTYSIGKVGDGTGLKMGEGIALVADASKQIARGLKPGEIGTDLSKTSIYQSIDGFLDTIRTNGKPWVSALEGYQANVLAAKANEACLKNTRIEMKKEWFVL